MALDYKDKYLRTFAENQILKKQRNDHLEQIKLNNKKLLFIWKERTMLLPLYHSFILFYKILKYDRFEKI